MEENGSKIVLYCVLAFEKCRYLEVGLKVSSNVMKWRSVLI